MKPKMEPIGADDPQSKSADIVAANVARLRELFPEAFSEGEIDFNVLKQLLGGAVDEREEKYGLNWNGKRRARQLALTPSAGTLRPAPDESEDWKNTRNLMIEGDNLEVLKLLQKSYSGRVKLIYIDPPYNTGKDFVYKDDFRDSIGNYKRIIGDVDDEGSRLTSNSESSGRFHTNWLNMMYPRLRLARNLLTPDGFIAVSIDDTELQSLRELMSEIYGEENYVATLVYDRNRKNDAKLFSVGHEYMVIYARDRLLLAEMDVRLRAKKEGVDEIREAFDRLRHLHNDNWTEVAIGLREFYAGFEDDDPRQPLTRYTKVDERGPYRTDGNPSWPGGGGPRYDVPHPVTGRNCKVPSRGWVWPTYERMKEEIDKGNIIFGEDETTIPGVRMTLFEADDQVMRSVIFSYAQKASQDFAKLFDGLKVFDNPKNYNDIAKLIGYMSSSDSIILDFFAGSGTTGHAAMVQNSVDGGKRRYILVQLPEPLNSNDKDQKVAATFCEKLSKPLTIAEITKERLRRAAKQVKGDRPLFAGDTGFRVYKLDTSNIRLWEPDPGDLAKSLFDSTDHLKDNRSEEDILTELLLKLGLDLCVPIDTKGIAKKRVHSIGGGVLLVCLDEAITAKEVEALALGIVAWHKQLAPAGETQVVLRDSAFDGDDVAKTNLTAILAQHGLTNIRSL